jgi:hypothetical protein
MKTVLFTLALLAQMTVHAAVPDRSVDTTASVDAATNTEIVAKNTKGNQGPKQANNNRKTRF